MKTHLIALLTLLVTLLTTQAQNEMQPHSQPVAFAAILKDKAAAKKAIEEINKQHQPLENAGIENLHFFTQSINGKEIILATMDINPTAVAKTTEDAWIIITESPLFKTNFEALKKAIHPHPRQTDTNKSPWVQTETICKLRPNNAAAPKPQNPWYSAVTGLKKEKEAEYRLLHNNVWPGVIHAIGASNINRFDIFLIEFGDNQPYLFYLFQYNGSDFASDMKSQSKSPVTQRWWKFTDACQTPLPEAKHGPWLDMNPL